MKAREYCCCAIPIVNAGIYAAILEQLVLGVVAGTLSIATSSSMSRLTSIRGRCRNSLFFAVVGAATPGAAKWIFAIVCYIGAGLQVLGLVAVSKVSKPSIRRHSAAACNKVLSAPSLGETHFVQTIFGT